MKTIVIGGYGQFGLPTARHLAGFELIDVDADAALRERYTVRVPVVAVDGVELFDYEVDADALRAALRS
jgi:Trk K+ transport system NAD-binding subunit